MISKHTGALTALTLPAGGRLLVGQVARRDRHDLRVPIPAREYRRGDFEADARCRHCPAQSDLSYQGTEVLLLIIHRGGCPELAAIRALVAP